MQGLDNDNRIHRWTIEELEAIRAEAYADLRALKSSGGSMTNPYCESLTSLRNAPSHF